MIGQNIDYLVDGESGVLIAPGDARGFGEAMERLLRDPNFGFGLAKTLENESPRNSPGMARRWKTVWQPIDNFQDSHLCGF